MPAGANGTGRAQRIGCGAQAAVHGQRRAGHLVGRFGSQKHRRAAQLLGRDEIQRGLFFSQQFLGRFGMTPPPPDDHVQAEAERQAETEAHRASLPLDELALFDVGDNPLGQALARLARSMKQRESAKQTESPSSSIKR